MNAKLHAVLGAPRIIIITFITIGFNSEGLIAIIISVIMELRVIIVFITA
jgi:hypothetical protein